MVLGIVCFRDAIAVYPSEWDVTKYCSQALTGGGVRLGCDRMDVLTGRACYLAGVSTVPCDFINPRLEGSAYSRDNFYHINFHSQQSALVTIMHLLFVNNWHITMNGFILATSEVAALYFILFYLFMVRSPSARRYGHSFSSDGVSVTHSLVMRWRTAADAPTEFSVRFRPLLRPLTTLH